MVYQKTKKILVVEDNQMMRSIIFKKLISKGYEVIEAENGKDGLEKCLNEKPDMIVLDLLMPEMNGFEMLKLVRDSGDGEIANVPVIILTNLWDQKNKDLAEKLKIHAYFLKAFLTTEDLAKAIDTFFDSEKNT
jgi:two-component system alkaline phosphatase synthesis response regulator PhoP